MTTNLAIKSIATETKALILLNEYEGRQLPMSKLRQILHEITSGQEETNRIIELIENHLRAEGGDPNAAASFIAELASPVMAVVDELGKTTRRLRSPFAMGFETATGAINITGQQGGNTTPLPNLAPPPVPTNVHLSGPMGDQPSQTRRLTPAQGMASGYGPQPTPPAPPPPPPPPQPLHPPRIPSPVQGTNVPFPPPPLSQVPNIPMPAGPPPQAGLPPLGAPPPYNHPPGQGVAVNVPRPGLGARPSGTVMMHNPNPTVRPMVPPGVPVAGPVGRVTPIDPANMAKPSAHQAPLPGVTPVGARDRNTMAFGKAQPARSQGKDDGRPVILVADDDKRVRMVHKIRLEEAGYSIVEAADGTEAWRRLQIGDITLAVLDMKMPGLHGLEVLSRLIDSNRKIPVVICSAYDQLKDEFIVATYPWLRYLVKPVTPEAMMTAVKDLLAQVSKSA
ncbi:MAG: response regulator [Planctomycetota bacterium]